MSTFLTPPSKKRTLLDENEDPTLTPPVPRLMKRSLRIIPSPRLPGECGKLVTVDCRRGRLELVIQLSKSFRIGRDKKNDYTVGKGTVSAFHAQVYALKADTGETIVCFEDTSSNGSMHNDRALLRSTVVLSDGDRVEIGGQGFTWRQEASKRGLGRAAGDQISQRIGEYIVFDRTLGSGAFSVVHLAFNTWSLKQIACKKIRKRRLSKGDIANVTREIDILKTISHPNINAVENAYYHEEEICIFLQLVAGGDLFTYLSKNLAKDGPLSAAETKFILYQVLKSVDYLHREKNISHRDIKLENIIVSGSGPFPKVLLADFGAARVASTSFNSITGTLIYLAPPECLNSSTRHGGYDGKLLDIWSCGIVFTTLLLGYHPFETTSLHGEELQSYEASLLGSPMSALDDDDGTSRDARTCGNVLHGDIALPREPFGSDDGNARALIHWMLATEPSQRCSALQALESNWIVGSQKELEAKYTKVVLGRKA